MTRNEQILSEVQKKFLNDKTHIASKVNAFIATHKGTLL